MSDQERNEFTLETRRQINKYYRERISDVETYTMFNQLVMPQLPTTDAPTKPTILLMGQYSTGKTSFIRSLVGRDYATMNIGAEPTTDMFSLISHRSISDQHGDLVIPGNAVVADPTLGFEHLTHLGKGFLERFQQIQLTNAPILEYVNLIDTPGALSTSRSRGYDFASSISALCCRVDMVLIFFDAGKLDMSEELSDCLTVCQSHIRKIRIVLNKVDLVNESSLMRIFGSLMWTLGRFLSTVEPARVYILSTSRDVMTSTDQRDRIEADRLLLMQDICRLLASTTLDMVSSFSHRLSALKAHIALLMVIKDKLPLLFGKVSKQAALLKDLRNIYIAARTKLPGEKFTESDFVPQNLFAQRVTQYDIILSDIKLPKIRDINVISNLQKTEIPEMMRTIPTSAFEDRKILPLLNIYSEPFFDKASSKLSTTMSLSKYALDFNSLQPIDGRIKGAVAKQELLKSQLPTNVLHKIWNLSCTVGDGKMGIMEYTIARELIGMRLAGLPLPDQLPPIDFENSTPNLSNEQCNVPEYRAPIVDISPTLRSAAPVCSIEHAPSLSESPRGITLPSEENHERNKSLQKHDKFSPRRRSISRGRDSPRRRSKSRGRDSPRRRSISRGRDLSRRRSSSRRRSTHKYSSSSRNNSHEPNSRSDSRRRRSTSRSSY